MKGAVLEPGDRILVRNLQEHGRPEKLRSYWKKVIYVVKEQMSEIPVYMVYPEGGDGNKTRTRHRNLLLPISDLPVATPLDASKSVVRRKPQKRHSEVSDLRRLDAESDNSEDDQSSGGVTG